MRIWHCKDWAGGAKPSERSIQLRFCSLYSLQRRLGRCTSSAGQRRTAQEPSAPPADQPRRHNIDTKVTQKRHKTTQKNALPWARKAFPWEASPPSLAAPSLRVLCRICVAVAPSLRFVCRFCVPFASRRRHRCAFCVSFVSRRRSRLARRLTSGGDR